MSLAMSSLDLEHVLIFFPEKFKPYRSLKINLANNPIGTFGAHHILSIIPDGVVNL